MIRNYFKIAWRNLLKTKTYSFLNIFGLAIGITCASLIFLWVEDEVTFDNYFPNQENIHLVRTKQTYEGNTYSFTATPGPLSKALKADIPEIEQSARSTWTNPRIFSLGDKTIKESGIYADPSYIDVFSLQFIDGDPNTALTNINSLVITESMAERFFGENSAVGKALKVDNNEEYLITGVVEDYPANTSYTFDWIIPFKKYEADNEWLETWGNNGLLTFVQLKPTADLSQVNQKIYEFIEEKTGGETTWSKIFLYPMERWHLYSSFDSNGNEIEGSVKYVRLFGIIAWVVLLIACINFMNLATARSEKRAKEVGVRKAVGAEKNTLRIQFICEAFLMSAIATVFSVFLTWLSLGSFNTMVNKELVLGLTDPVHLIALVSIILVCGLLAGSYPAFYLSSFNPISVLKGLKLKTGSAGWIRKALVVTQFSASIILIICTVIVYQQVQHVKNRDLGYNKEQVLMTSFNGAMVDHLPVLKDQLLSSGYVENIGVSNMSVLLIGSNTSGINWEGKDQNKDVLIGIQYINEDYLTTLDMQLLSGRNYRPNMLGDSTGVIINEAFAKLIQEDAQVVGQTVTWDTTLTIIGVVKDFVYNDMYSSPEPLMMYPLQAGQEGMLYVKLKRNIEIDEAVASIGQLITQNNPGYPFEYRFLDDQFNNVFITENMIQKLVSVFGVLSIVISCLGLFGLAAFTAERRTKEIGVRKVLGASVASLANLLSKEFVMLVLISCLIAFPISWVVMYNWLGKYNYHTDIHWVVFAAAGLGALIIALATVSSQAIKAAIANPVDSLRDE